MKTKRTWRDSTTAVYIPLWLEFPELIERVPPPKYEVPIGDEHEAFDEDGVVVIDMS